MGQVRPVTVRLERVAGPDVPWADLDRRPDRTVHQTREWLDLLVEVHGVEPVTCRVLRGDATVGWFAGGLVHRAGIRMRADRRGWRTATSADVSRGAPPRGGPGGPGPGLRRGSAAGTWSWPTGP